MKRARLLSLALAAALGLLGPSATLHAAIVAVGDVTPDPAAPDSGSKPQYIGNAADGSLAVDAGDKLDSRSSHIALASGVIGQATISGAGSRWNCGNALYVGVDGDGTLAINHGATVSVDGPTYVAYGATSTGSIAFGPGGGTLTTCCLAASPAQLRGTGTIDAIGLMSDIDLVFDSDASLTRSLKFDGEPNQDVTVNIDLRNLENVWFQLGAGYAGSGSLTVRNGVVIESSNGFVGYKNGSTGTALITGAGSAWNNAYAINIGNEGAGSLTIADGGSVASAYGNIGVYEGSGGEVTIRGAGSTWNTGGFQILRGTLAITDGGVLSGGDAHGGATIGQNAVATVRGAGSAWTDAADVSLSGTLLIADGGTLSGGNADVGGSVTLSGRGSTWTSSGYLHLECDATFLVTDGAMVRARDLQVDFGRTLLITDGGLVSVVQTLAIDDFDHGGVGPSAVNIASGGRLALAGDADDSLSDFLNLVQGSDAIRYWDAAFGDWANITGATRGADYTLAYMDNRGSDLFGYTVLTVGTIPEPSALPTLLVGAAMSLVRRTLTRGQKRLFP